MTRDAAADPIRLVFDPRRSLWRVICERCGVSGLDHYGKARSWRRLHAAQHRTTDNKRPQKMKENRR